MLHSISDNFANKTDLGYLKILSCDNKRYAICIFRVCFFLERLDSSEKTAIILPRSYEIEEIWFRNKKIPKIQAIIRYAEEPRSVTNVCFFIMRFLIEKCESQSSSSSFLGSSSLSDPTGQNCMWLVLFFICSPRREICETQWFTLMGLLFQVMHLFVCLINFYYIICCLL